MSGIVRLAALTGLLCAVAIGCDDDTGSEKQADAGHPHPDAGPPPRSVYALQTMVYQPDDSVTSYVVLTDTIDVDAVAAEDGREFASYAFITTLGGKLLVSSGEDPSITQYAISDELDWEETAKISFANQGLPSYGAGFERHWFLDERTAYLTLDITSRIVWDPSTFEIISVKEDTKLESKRDELVLDAAFNRPPQDLKGPVLKPFYYRDEDWFRFGGNTPLAVYDPKTHEESKIIDVPCPGLEVASQDEDGNTYFSPWTYGPALSLFGEGPKPCVRRITSDSELDESWAPNLTEWTDGRPVHVFRYVGKGKAVGTVLHLEEVKGDFDSGYNEELAVELESHWRLWTFDLEAETAAPIKGIGSSGSGFSMAVLEGRTFIFVPNTEWSETTIYELDEAGQANEHLKITGIVNNWLKLR